MFLVAHLTGLNIKTLRSLVARFEQKRWRDSGPWVAVGNDGMAGGRAATSVSDPAALDVVADLNDLRDRHDTALPAVHLPEDDTSNLCHDNAGSDSDVDFQFGQLPARSRPGQLAAWQQHPNYATGMRVAELATQWITRGQPVTTYPKFMMWARNVCGPAIGGTPLFGEINHSSHFICEFTQALKRAVDFSTYASMHALVPATGLASDLTRVIDIVTIGGVSLLVILHVLTDPAGKLVWHVLGCPAVDGHVGGDSSAGCDVAPAGGGKSSFRFHSAAHLTQLVHTLRGKFRYYQSIAPDSPRGHFGRRCHMRPRIHSPREARGRAGWRRV